MWEKQLLHSPVEPIKDRPVLYPLLKQGAGVVTTRGHVHYIITEYGVAFLYEKTCGSGQMR